MGIKNSWTLTDRQLCDCEMILDGSFYPLNHFMTEQDYNKVLEEMRIVSGQLFPLPIVLDVDENFFNAVKLNEHIILKNKEGFSIAKMTIESMWEPDLRKEALQVYKTTDRSHPGVSFLLNSNNKFYLGGEIQKIKMPNHYDFEQYRMSPNDVRKKFKKMGWNKIIGFQTRNPLHRAHVEMTFISMNEVGAKLLLHPAVGLTKDGDIDHYTRVRCYEHVIKKYPKDSAFLALLPLAMRMGGPREALLHAIIRKNFGCSHFIIGRDHAGPGLDSKGDPFYSPYESQELVKKFESEIDIQIIPFQFMVYVPKYKKYQILERLDRGVEHKKISGTELRRRLDHGEEIPDWFSYPEIVTELKKSRPPLEKKGLTIFFTGLSGSGKSTIANGLLIKLLEEGSRTVSLLDGDIVRTHLSSELGFSKEHRSLNVRRIGFVASEITKNGGIAICAPIAPYDNDRQFNRNLISQFGNYFEIYVNTSLEVCERRDVKGLYKLARKGKVEKFTGISDPYQPPLSPDLTLNSDGQIPLQKLIKTIIDKLVYLNYMNI